MVGAMFFILSHYMGFLANYLGMMVHLLVFFFTVSYIDIFTFFNVCCIKNDFIINITFLMFIMPWDFVTFLFLLVMTMRTLMMLILNMTLMSRLSSTIHKS